MKIKYLIFLIIFWTGLAAASLYWNIQVTKIDLIEETRTALISYYNLLEMTRQWNTMHKGVYAEIKGNVLPNKYLYSDRSLIETKDGRKLSYINMHIMTKQLSELIDPKFTIKFKLTSLVPLDESNKADNWESKILKNIDSSTKPVFEYRDKDSIPKFRLLAPLRADSTCIECHGINNVKVGDILGGLSLSCPEDGFLKSLMDHTTNDITIHVVVYFVVLIGLFYFSKLINKYSSQLEKSLNEEKDLYDNAPFGYHTLDADGYIIRMNKKELDWLGYTSEELYYKVKFAELIAPESREDYLQKCLCNLNNKGLSQLDEAEFYITRKDGSIFPILVSSVAIRDKNGKIINCLNSVLDITDRKQADLKIQESERKFRNIFNNVQDVFYQTDMSGILIEISPSIERYSGYRKEDLIGKPADFFYDNPQDRLELMKLLLEKGEVNDFELVLKKKDGTKILVSANIHIMYNSKNHAVGIEGSLRDINERKAMEDALKSSEQLLKAIFESTSAGILVVDENRRVQHFNIRFLEMWQISLEIADSKDDNKMLNHVIHQIKNPEEFLKKIDQIYESSSYVIDVIELNDGRYLERISIPMLRNNKIFGRVWNFHDITDQKKAELVLKEANASKDKFFSILAHDLRSPISGFVGITEILSKELDELSVREVKEMSTAIYNSANSIFNLLNDLLKWAQSQSNELRLDLEEIDLIEIINETVTLLKASVERKKITLSKDLCSKLLINADKNMITTVIRNLINNSIKFTKEDGNINISVTVDNEENPEFVKVSVNDNGIGIDSEKLKLLFKVGEYRSSLGTSGEKGTGLGLILCKEFIEKHGGHIFVQSNPGEGSTFSFTLPIKSLNN